MASSASSCMVDDFFESPTCWCGLKASLKTSKTNKNPGRRFFACSKYNTVKHSFFGHIFVLLFNVSYSYLVQIYLLHCRETQSANSSYRQIYFNW
ncbi:hypothetical protein I3842_05G150400 [Carya illinoinensis]|uniref:GRF-type domain-containing protein n=1 Tax=Carya illinoinensis TaxID=32201 RepID=A0A922JMM7_CARIL|nr:hypothetical protein I3842_05G150400 [Carya illinoinensis]